MILRELLRVIDNRIYVEVYNINDFRIAEDYSTVMIRHCDEKILNKTVRMLSYDFESTDLDIALQITVEDE